jgi:hypothetical protein
MALSLGQAGTEDSLGVEYLLHDPAESPVSVHMHLDTVDGIARDTLGGFTALPKRGAEVGGLLLGHVEPGERPVVWIDRYQRIECAHHFGPQFVLDDDEREALERAAASIAQDSELTVVGFYRSHTRSGFQLEEADLEFVGRYFNDPADIILLIHPETMTHITGWFFARGPAGGMEAAGSPFAFRGRTDASLVAGPDASFDDVQPDTARMSQPDRLAVPDRTALPDRMRRIVPDFAQAAGPERPLPDRFPKEPFADPRQAISGPLPPEVEPPSVSVLLRKWLPLIAALLLVAGAVWFLMSPAMDRRESAVSRPTGVASPIRPLGLYVDPSGANWRVSWNPSATALRDAHSVLLFVRDGDDQNRIDLSPADLQSGTYQYLPKGSDVTFRLEVKESTGHISAESFRFMKSSPPLSAAAAPRTSPVQSYHPVAVHRVPPVVPASIRPRIAGPISIDVRVAIDSRGRVTSATPVGKHAGGLPTYLADRAVTAARQWRFEANNPGSETIHFVFEK